MHFLPATAPLDDCYDPQARDELKASCPGFELVASAYAAGMSITYCAPGEGYLRASTGWERYLELWPQGPEADVAWWNVHIEPPCCDECTPESLEPYRDFIRRFPASQLRLRAEQRLHGQ
jgi:hypothetical protein